MDIFEAARAEFAKPATELDCLASRLHEWARWMRLGGISKGYKCQCVGLSSGGTSKTLDELCERADAVVMQAINTIIEHDLALSQRLAVHSHYLNAVYRMPRVDKQKALDDAHRAILIGLARRHVVI